MTDHPDDPDHDSEIRERQLLERVVAAIRKADAEPKLTEDEVRILRRVAHMMAGIETVGSMWSFGVRIIQVIGMISLFIMIAKTWSLADIAKLVGVR